MSFYLCCRRSVALLAVLLSACAQQTPLAPLDADLDRVVRQSMGRDIGRATPQIRLPLGSSQEDANTQRLPELQQAKTFLGTIACQHTACQGQAMRLRLTLAPAGHWRARTTRLTAQATDAVEQGCWVVLESQTPRILLLTVHDTVRARLDFLQGDTLRVLEYNGMLPILPSYLTQQHTIDPIAEMQKETLADCAPIYPAPTAEQ